MVTISRKTDAPRGWRLQASVFVPRPRPEVFEFFSDAFQLETLTPEWLKFQVVTPRPIVIREGILIDYRLRVHGLPLRWRSEITEFDPPFQFVDEQRKGPYSFWKHRHTFEEQDGGTLCGDVVDYGVPGGWLVNALVVERDVRAIFEFRRRKMAEIFGSATAPAAA